MDLALTEEQSMLVDSVARFIDNDYDFETRQKIAATARGFSDEVWRTCAELGWTAVPFAEEDGGLGGGPVELMLMMQQFGRGLFLEPYLANVVLAGGVLRRLAVAAQKEQWLAPLVGGELHAALAFAEPQARFDLGHVTTTARAEGAAWVVNGRKTLVLNGGAADLLIVPARTSGEATDAAGITLFALDAETPGLARRSYRTVDGQQAAELELVDVRVGAGAQLGGTGGGFATLQAAVDDATLAICAEAVGIMRTLHDKTVDYSKSRVQFGVPIGSFQALQHRMVDTLIGCEQSLSLLLWAAMVNADSNADTKAMQQAISALKYQVGTTGVQVAREAVQLHGGMGVSWELDVAHYFKRITAIGLLFGNADYHLDRYVSLS